MRLQSIVEKTRKVSSRQKIFEQYYEELKGLLSNKKNKLKIKSIYEVIQKRHDIRETSLSSFKRYLRANNLRRETIITCRIEQPPGSEIQVDYAAVGKLINPLTGRSARAYVFIGTLSSSRHKYAEFVFKQDQKSFVESHVKMFRFFGGLTKIITLDNLKAGVTHLAKAFAHLACRKNLRVSFFSFANLIAGLTKSELTGKTNSLLRTLYKADLLVIDDFAFKKLSPQRAEYLYTVIDERMLRGQ